MTRFALGLVIAAVTAVAGPASAQQDWGCPYRGANPAARRSPLDSTVFQLGGTEVKLCYGRPSSRGRTMLGGRAAPYGRIWRTGANETTKIHSEVALSLGGVAIPAGTYALYTVPGENEWQIIVNRAWQQWGRENYYGERVRAQELTRITVPRERLDDHVETFTIRTERTNGTVDIVLEWEHTRVRLPVGLGG